MTLTVRLFARIRESLGQDTLVIILPDKATIADLRLELIKCFPELATLLAVSAIAINHDFADDARVLASHDEIAIIPPVSGG